jgi:hypothetical protein
MAGWAVMMADDLLSEAPDCRQGVGADAGVGDGDGGEGDQGRVRLPLRRLRAPPHAHGLQ